MSVDVLSEFAGNIWLRWSDSKYHDGKHFARQITYTFRLSANEAHAWLVKQGHTPPSDLQAIVDAVPVSTNEPADQPTPDEKMLKRFEVEDLDLGKLRVFDPTGFKFWGPVADMEGWVETYEVPQYFTEETLYFDGKDHWTLIVERRHWEAPLSNTPEAKQITAEEADQWLGRNGFPAAGTPASGAETRETPKTSYLGVMVHDRKVRREGFDEEIDFGGKRATWMLLKFLLDAGENGMSRSDLMKAIWPENTPQPNALDKRKSAVSELLVPLNLEIHADKRGTWRLQDLRHLT